MFDDKPKEGGGIQKPGVDVFGGRLEPAKIGSGYGARWTRKFASGGKTSSASKRADGCAIKGKTRGKIV
jgi:hypothetical protein